MLSNRKEQTRFFRFAIVGAIGAVVDFAVLNLLLQNDVKYVYAATISFILAVINNYLWNRFWTYPDSRSKNPTRQFIQFGIINAIGLAIRIPLLAWLEKILISFSEQNLANLPLSPETIGHNIGLAIAIIVVMFWNFFANRFWTFNDVDD